MPAILNAYIFKVLKYFYASCRSESIDIAGNFVKSSLQSLIVFSMLIDLIRVSLDLRDTIENQMIPAIKAAWIVTAKKKTKIGQKICLQVFPPLKTEHVHSKNPQRIVNPPRTIAPYLIKMKLSLPTLSTFVKASNMTLRGWASSHVSFQSKVGLVQKSKLTFSFAFIA